ESGAYSYLVKPVALDDLRVQVQRALERRRLLEERQEHLRELELAYRRERRIAETLQRWLIGEVPNVLPGGIRLAHRYQAAMREADVGGDFYDVFPLNEGRVGLLMGDVSGKGLNAARYTALAKHFVYAYALDERCPARVMERTSRALNERAPFEAFVTLFFGVLNPADGHLVYANAGHEPALLYRGEGGPAIRLAATGPPAGALPGVRWRAGEVWVHRGDTLLLYTDGATEARQGEHWLCTEGLERLAGNCLMLDPETALARIHEAILEFADGRLYDDVALLLLRREE
ncbi:MAG: SpoIIE family protein phosphatase, partial [Armatimonadota bacterium]|nr:SpoIIE family protein phosphatase [Armatimonadota bacterium]